jgi:hypothetical protein
LCVSNCAIWKESGFGMFAARKKEGQDKGILIVQEASPAGEGSIYFSFCG